MTQLHSTWVSIFNSFDTIVKPEKFIEDINKLSTPNLIGYLIYLSHHQDIYKALSVETMIELHQIITNHELDHLFDKLFPDNLSFPEHQEKPAISINSMDEYLQALSMSSAKRDELTTRRYLSEFPEYFDAMASKSMADTKTQESIAFDSLSHFETIHFLIQAYQNDSIDNLTYSQLKDLQNTVNVYRLETLFDALFPSRNLGQYINKALNHLVFENFEHPETFRFDENNRDFNAVFLPFLTKISHNKFVEFWEKIDDSNKATILKYVSANFRTLEWATKLLVMINLEIYINNPTLVTFDTFSTKDKYIFASLLAHISEENFNTLWENLDESVRVSIYYFISNNLFGENKASYAHGKLN